MIGLVLFFIPIAESLLGGYLIAVTLYGLLILLMGRLGPKLLMHNHRMSMAYSTLHALIWGVAAVAGTYVSNLLAPLQPYGGVVLPLLLALLLVVVALRSFRQNTGQVSGAAVSAILLSITLGTVGVLFVHGAFRALALA